MGLGLRALAAATLVTAFAACSRFEPPSLAQADVLSGLPGTFGAGEVRGVAVLADAPPEQGRAYRLFVQMDSGASLSVDVDNASFMADERVEILPDGRIVRITGTTFSR